MEVCRPANHCLIGAACTYWSLEGVHVPQWPRQDGIGRGKRFNETLILDTINACICRLAFSSKSSSIFTDTKTRTPRASQRFFTITMATSALCTSNRASFPPSLPP